MAFGSCVSELCLYIQRSIMNIFNTAEELSLLYVYHHIDNLSLIVQKMVLLCHINDESEVSVLKTLVDWSFII
jgi:hypothetical protein